MLAQKREKMSMYIDISLKILERLKEAKNNFLITLEHSRKYHVLGNIRQFEVFYCTLILHHLELN